MGFTLTKNLKQSSVNCKVLEIKSVIQRKKLSRDILKKKILDEQNVFRLSFLILNIGFRCCVSNSCLL